MNITLKNCPVGGVISDIEDAKVELMIWKIG